MNETRIARLYKSEAKSLDAFDKRILRIVQRDANRSVSDIAAEVGLSQTPCWKRLRQLTVSGAIKRKVALLDQKKLGLGTTVIVSIKAGTHSSKDLARFAAKIAAMEEVMTLYRLAGDTDFVLTVVVPNQEAYEEFYQRLVKLFPFKDVTSRFVLENIKYETAFPIRD
ncbi:MAG TPA: Lrp/AsnC family transcriptional regulator [Methylocella sp.]|nr:Lrp/AsnC family transcriptional regulator [Methylocella sp.]